MTIFKKSVLILFLFSSLFIVAHAGKKNSWSAMYSNGLQFTENKGQIIDQEGKPQNNVLYTGDVGNGTKIYFRKNTISYVQSKVEGLEENEEEEMKESMETGYDPVKEQQEKMEHAITKIHRIDLEFLNTNTNVKIIAEDKTKDYTNYFLPQCKDGVTANSFSKLIYKNIYPHIDIIFHPATPSPSGRVGEGLEYDFILNPGANPNDIKINYSGADEIRLEDQSLIIKTSIGEIREYIPESYQMIDGKKVKVDVRYVLSETPIANNKNNTTPYSLFANGYELSFKLSTFNSGYVLVIDPWATYYGGGSISYAGSIATDNLGNVVITAKTNSNNFPISAGAFQSVSGGLRDACVVKFNANGNRLWATYYGGSNEENSLCYGSITTDNLDNVIITGSTNSTDFPVSGPPLYGTLTFGLDQNSQPTADAFIVKFNPNGVPLWATYYGGSSDEVSNTVAADNSGNIIITGYTSSPDFPVSLGAFQSNLKLNSNGTAAQDIFVVKLDFSGNFLFATYYGGSNADYGNGVAIDNNKNIVITGGSWATDFPVSTGAFQGNFGGAGTSGYPGFGDGILVKFDSLGNRLWATYFGGSDDDSGLSVAIDNTGRIAITGSTRSNNFPVSPGAYDATYSIYGAYEEETFLARFDDSGNRLWATYFKAFDDAEGTGIDIDANGGIYITGATEAKNLPISPCAIQTHSGTWEACFLAKFDSVGNYICSTYNGGTECLGFTTVALSGVYANVIITGGQQGLPVSVGAFQTNLITINGWTHADAYVIQICANSCGFASSSFTAVQTSVCVGKGVDFTSYSSSSCNGIVNYSWIFAGASPQTSSAVNPTGIIYNAPGSYDVQMIANAPCSTDTVILYNYIHVYPPLSVTIAPSTTICEPNSVVLSASASGADGVYTYHWSPINSNNSSVSVSPSTASTFSVTVSNAYCNPVSDYVTINVYPQPTALFSYDPDSPTFIDIVHFIDLSKYNIVSWNWNFNDPDNSTSIIPNPQLNFPDTGTYIITLIISDIHGCWDTILQPLHIKADFVFYIPNSFTPDGDNNNDVFRPYSSIISKISMIIFDRWGNRIFETSDINTGWDGKVNGVMAQEDVYVYVITAVDYKNERQKYTGHLSLIK